MFIIFIVVPRYSLKPPSNSMIESYVEGAFSQLLKDEIDKEKIIKTFLQNFKNLTEDMCSTRRWKAACRIVAKKLVRANLALRKKLVGELLKAIRAISQQSLSDDVFEEGSHTVYSEPYFVIRRTKFLL